MPWRLDDIRQYPSGWADPLTLPLCFSTTQGKVLSPNWCEQMPADVTRNIRWNHGDVPGTVVRGQLRTAQPWCAMCFCQIRDEDLFIKCTSTLAKSFLYDVISFSDLVFRWSVLHSCVSSSQIQPTSVSDGYHVSRLGVCPCICYATGELKCRKAAVWAVCHEDCCEMFNTLQDCSN